MTTPSNTIEELVERVEAATGPDADLDKDIIAALGFHSWAGRMSYRGEGGTSWDFGSSDITASIDAALALAERVLPGLSPGVSQNVHHGNWYAWFADGEQRADGQFTSTEVAEANHDFSAPLAIILATLKALSRIKGDHNDEA